jgi:hypothetical protein
MRAARAPDPSLSYVDGAVTNHDCRFGFRYDDDSGCENLLASTMSKAMLRLSDARSSSIAVEEFLGSGAGSEAGNSRGVKEGVETKGEAGSNHPRPFQDPWQGTKARAKA